MLVSAINGLPAEPTSFAITDNLTDDDISEISIESIHSPTLTSLTDHFSDDLQATSRSLPLKRAKRKFVHRPLFVYRRYHQRDRALEHVKKPKNGIDNRNDRYHYRRNYIDLVTRSQYDGKSSSPPTAINLYASSRRAKRRAIHRPLFVFCQFHQPHCGRKSVPDNEHDELRRI